MNEYYERNLIFYANKFFVECINNFFETESTEIESVFHYTSTEVFDKIIEKATFRASNVFYLNDSQEYKNGIETLKAMIKKQHEQGLVFDSLEKIVNNISSSDGKSFPGLYTISFSKEPDSLHQWITYAKESGVAIELDYKLLQKNSGTSKWWLKQDIENESNAGVLEMDIMKPLKYSFNTKETNNFAMAWENVLNIMDEFSTAKEKEDVSEITLRMLASHIKNERFTSESEVRIATFPLQIRDNHTKIHYFSTKGILRPYIDVSFGYYQNDGFVKAIPIKSITIGPSGKQQTVFDSVVHRLTYGVQKVYQYNLEELNNNLSSYCNMVKEYYSKLEPITEDLVDIIKISWFNKNEEYLNKAFPKLKNIDISELIGIKNLNLKLNSRQNEILHKINEDFHFTREGIIIKKSSTPYIF